MPVIGTPAVGRFELTGPYALPQSVALPAEGPLTRLAAEHQDLLRDELRPSSYLQNILVRELARHAAGLDLAHAAEDAVLQHNKQNLAILASDGAHEHGLGQAHLPSDALLRAARYRSGHTRELLAELRAFLELKKQPSALDLPSLFESEDECIAYLRDWQKSQPWSCPACQSSTRYFLSIPKFECACRVQYSLRHGTIFERSKAPLLVWFEVGFAMCAAVPTNSPTFVARVTVTRKQTLGRLTAAVRAALQKPDAQQQLAGLPDLVARHLRQVLARGA